MKADQYIARPEDDGHAGTAAALEHVQAMLAEGKPARIQVSRYVRGKTPPQLRTIWQWHTEVASQLTEHCRAAGYSFRWNREEVHEVVFKPRFMPRRTTVMPDGTTVDNPKGLSDSDTDLGEVSEAMDAYLAWITGQGYEVTVPDDYGELLRHVGLDR